MDESLLGKCIGFYREDEESAGISTMKTQNLIPRKNMQLGMAMDAIYTSVVIVSRSIHVFSRDIVHPKPI